MIPLADGHKTYAKRAQRTSKISGLAPSVFIRSRNGQFAKTVNIGNTYAAVMLNVCSKEA
jgi:hypothetical protein